MLRHSKEKIILWQDVQVGDLLKVHDHELIPADGILLSSSDPKGTCFLETSNLDGEANLKARTAIPITLDLVSNETNQVMKFCFKFQRFEFK